MAPPPADRRILVVLPPALIRLFPGCDPESRVAAATVDQMIDALDGRWPGMRDRLCDSTPRVRRHINIFIAGERASLRTPLPAGAEVFIMTAISGG